MLPKARCHSNGVFSLFLSANIKKYRENNKQIFCTFDMKSNDFGAVIHENLKNFLKIIVQKAA